MSIWRHLTRIKCSQVKKILWKTKCKISWISSLSRHTWIEDMIKMSTIDYLGAGSKARHDLVTKKQLFATECLLTVSITARPHVDLCFLFVWLFLVFFVFSLVFDFLTAVNHMSSTCRAQSILLAFYHCKQLQIMSPWSVVEMSLCCTSPCFMRWTNE